MIKFKELPEEMLQDPEMGSLDTRRRVEAQVGNLREGTRNTILHMAKPAPDAKPGPEAGADKGREAANKPVEKVSEKPMAKSTDKPNNMPENKPAEPAPEPSPPASPPTKWQKIKNWFKGLKDWATGGGAKPALGLGAAGGIVAGGSSVADWPVLGKIPYLPQIASGLQGALTSVTNTLGLGTGPAATASWLQNWPSWLYKIGGSTMPAALGPTVLGAGGLLALGKLNEWLTGKKGGLLRSFWNGVRAPVDIPMWGLNKFTKIPSQLKKGANWVLNRPSVQWVRQNIVAPTTKFVGNVIKPTKWGLGAGVAGWWLLSGATGGQALVWAGAGYGLVNLLNNSGVLHGRGGGAAATPEPAVGHA
jgi:hypothetical protein